MTIINWVDSVNWSWKRNLKADVLSNSPSLKQIKELWVVCGLYTERWSYAQGCALGKFSGRPSGA